MYVLQNYLPIVVCVTYYVVVFLLAELSRRVVDLLVKKGTLLYTFLIELIGTAQMCTCIYENGFFLNIFDIKCMLSEKDFFFTKNVYIF